MRKDTGSASHRKAVRKWMCMLGTLIICTRTMRSGRSFGGGHSGSALDKSNDGQMTSDLGNRRGFLAPLTAGPAGIHSWRTVSAPRGTGCR